MTFREEVLSETTSLVSQTSESPLDQTAPVTYIVKEYSKIPIDIESEFRETVRLARLNQKSLKIIVCDNKSQPNQKRYLDLPATSFSKHKKKFSEKMNATSNSSCVRKTCCHCKEDVQPEWFTHYMKRFKKQLFHELKSYIHSAINGSVEKEKKLTAKSDTHDVVCKKRESLFPGNTQIKKEKLEKDSPDIIDQRELKLQRKLEKLLTSKSERLEKLDNKILKSSNEEWLLKEAKLHSKRKFSRTLKSDKNEGCAPEEILGRVYGPSIPIKKSITPTGLSPTSSAPEVVKGKVSNSEGPHHVRCRAVDGEEAFICGEGMEPFTSGDKASGISAGSKESTGTMGEERNSVGALIDFEKDVIASSQKKIEENIIEIQKRLHDIDLLGPLTGTESNVHEEGVSGSEEKRKPGCDLLQDLEVKEKNLKQKMESERVLFGIDCLSLNQPLNEARGSITSEEKVSGNNNADNASNVESEHCSDSEMSVIFVSEEEDEEEENFVVIPSKSPSPAYSVNDDKVSPERESKTYNEQPEVSKSKSTNEEAAAQEETEQHKEEAAEGHFCHPNSRSRRSPFAEETFKPKKIKSKSTEYHFNTENLTQPTFTQPSEGVFVSKYSTFKFTAGEEENSQKHQTEKEEDCKEKKTPKAFDALGRVIYAVNSNGRCLPVEYMLEQKEQTTQPTRNPSGVPPGAPPGVSPGVGGRSADMPFFPHQQERRSDRSKEIPSFSILPNALMNGASNVASMAFNTAKSVINNLQSAFVTEGKTEWRHPAYEANAFQAFQDRRVSSEMLIRLCDMGFLNIELNRQLLLLNGNDLVATVEELIRLHNS